MRALVVAIGSAALVAAACGAPSDTMTVTGRVDLGPFCPVERAGSPCAVPPAAFNGVAAIATREGDEVRALVGADGTFALMLDSGAWQVTATAGMSCTPVTVSAPASVVITCDTGIR